MLVLLVVLLALQFTVLISKSSRHSSLILLLAEPFILSLSAHLILKAKHIKTPQPGQALSNPRASMPLLETITYLAGLIAITAGTAGAAAVSFVWLDPSLAIPSLAPLGWTGTVRLSSEPWGLGGRCQKEQAWSEWPWRDRANKPVCV